MKISVITINYNNVKGLEKTIKSVLSQTFNKIEYLIIDGGSTDGSLDILHKHSNFINYWISEKDDGIYHAMNKGILKATGEYLIFLNSGDCFCNQDAILSCLSFISNSPDEDIYYGDIYVSNSNNQVDWLKKYPSALSLSYFQETTINHQATLIKAELFKQFGLYPEEYEIAADFWLFLICLLNNKKYKYLDFPLVIYDNSGISATNIDKYINEKNIIWNKLVPGCVKSVLAENAQFKQLVASKIVKAAIRVSVKYQKLKSLI